MNTFTCFILASQQCVKWWISLSIRWAAVSCRSLRLLSRSGGEASPLRCRWRPGVLSGDDPNHTEKWARLNRRQDDLLFWSHANICHITTDYQNKSLVVLLPVRNEEIWMFCCRILTNWTSGRLITRRFPTAATLWRETSRITSGNVHSMFMLTLSDRLSGYVLIFLLPCAGQVSSTWTNQPTRRLTRWWRGSGGSCGWRRRVTAGRSTRRSPAVWSSAWTEPHDWSSPSRVPVYT